MRKFNFKFLYTNRLIALINLTWLTLALYSPYFTAQVLGHGDAKWYHWVLKDALLQYQQGIFPVYVGQGAYNFVGSPVGIGSWYFFLAGAIFWASKGLSALQIQHLTVIVSAIGGVYAMYFVLNKLSAEPRFLSFIFAFLYVSSPVMMGAITYFDSYRLFLTLPFLPFLVYGLIRTYQQNDFIAALLVGASLALIWLSHPPCGFWAGILCAIFYALTLLYTRKGLGCMLLSAFVFLLLSVWQLSFVLSAHIESTYLPQISNYGEIVLGNLRRVIPGIFLPVNWSNEQFAPIQLGYALWYLFILTIALSYFIKNNLNRILIFCLIFFVVLVFPIPFITYFIYAHLPHAIQDMNTSWPSERILPLLVTFILIASYLMFLQLLKRKEWRTFYKKALTVLLVLSIWNGLEATKFTLFASQSISKEAFPFWDRAENFKFWPKSGGINSPLPEGTYDPRLENRLLDGTFKPITGFDNHQTILSQCLAKAHRVSKEFSWETTSPIPFHEFSQKVSAIPLMQFTVLQGKFYAACVDLKSQYMKGIFHVYGTNHDTMLYYLEDKYAPKQNISTQQQVLLSVQSLEPRENKISLVFKGDPQLDKEAFVHFNRLGITTYDDSFLPIKIKSLFPFTAKITAHTNSEYLETYQAYLPGYEATVNQQKVTVLKAPDENVLIPLVKGVNEVTLHYVATPTVQKAFKLNVAAWIVALGIFAIAGLRRLLTSALFDVKKVAFP